jgi:hypothetical protein
MGIAMVAESVVKDWSVALPTMTTCAESDATEVTVTLIVWV